jgi:hypothetical protein
MVREYKLAAGTASTMKRLGSAGKDISELFVYVALHEYLEIKGLLGFVITQTVFQSSATDEFRNFMLPRSVPFRIITVDDFVKVTPFRYTFEKGATNKTATFVAMKGERTSYPLPYHVWVPTHRFDRDTASLEEVHQKTKVLDKWARPSNQKRANSLWELTDVRKRAVGLTAQAYPYELRRGVETGLESAFRIKVLEWLEDDLAFVENITKRARKPLSTTHGRVERKLIYPYLTGETISKWKAYSTGCYIVPHTPQTGMKPFEESIMKNRYRHAYAFLNTFREDLTKRSIHKRWGKSNPFYSLYDIGHYTFAKWKVVWKRSTRNFEAAVVSTLPINDHQAIAVPNGKVMMVPFNDPDSAYFFCGLVNSIIARYRVNSALTGEATAEILELVPLPLYDSKNRQHLRMKELSQECHKVVGSGDSERLSQLESELDQVAAEIWSVPQKELESIRTKMK